MSQSFIIPPRTTDGNEIRKFFVKVCQLINGTLETHNSLARAYLSANQTGIASGVVTKILLDTEDFDVGANFANYKYVCPVAGYYQIDWAVYCYDAGTKLGTITSNIYKNGAAVREGSVFSNLNTSYQKSTGSDKIQLSDGDYLELYGTNYTTDASTFDFVGAITGCFMSVHLIST
jgi:hypothetical protein